MPHDIDHNTAAQRRTSKLLAAMAIFICLGIVAYIILTLLVNRQTPANPDTHYTGTNGVSVYYDSSIWKVCQMTEDATLGTVLELATADSADGAEDYQAVLLQRGTADTYPDFIDDSEKDLKQAYGIIKPRTANITVEGAEVTAVRCDIQTYYAVLATITYDSGDVVYVSGLTKRAACHAAALRPDAQSRAGLRDAGPWRPGDGGRVRRQGQCGPDGGSGPAAAVHRL